MPDNNNNEPNPNDKTGDDKVFTQADIDAAVAKATDGLRAEVTKERQARQDFAKKFEDSEKSLKEIKDSIAADKAKKEEETLKSEGKYQEALDNVKAEYDKKSGDLQSQLDQKDAQIKKLLINNAILAAAGEACNPDEIVTLMTSKNMFKVVEKNGELSVEVYDENGIPLHDNDMKPASVKFAVERYLIQNPHHAKAQTKSGSGSDQTQTSGGNTREQELTKFIEDTKKSSRPDKNAQIIAAERELHDLQLANKT